MPNFIPNMERFNFDYNRSNNNNNNHNGRNFTVTFHHVVHLPDDFVWRAQQLRRPFSLVRFIGKILSSRFVTTTLLLVFLAWLAWWSTNGRVTPKTLTAHVSNEVAEVYSSYWSKRDEPAPPPNQ